MNKNIYLIPVLAGLVVLIGAACTTVQNNNAVVETASTVTNTTTPAQADADEAQAPSVDQYYMAEKVGTTTTVYKDTYETKAREEVFSFQEASEYEPGSGNTYMEMRPSIAYDRNSDTFAYATAVGLFLYTNQTGETTTLISNTGSSGTEIDEIDIPNWSVAELANVIFLIYPQFSADGKYLSFSGAFYEGMSTYIMNLETKENVELAGKDDRGISGYTVAWSPTGHSLVIGRGAGYGSAGLFSVTNEDFGNAEELLSMAGIEFTEVDQAVFVDVDTIAYTYSPSLNEPKRLAIINTDGSQQQDLVVDSVDNYVRAAYVQSANMDTGFVGKILYFKRDAYTPANDGLWIYDTKDQSNRQAVVEEDGQKIVLQSFNRDALVYIAYDTINQSSILYSINPETLENPYSAVQPTQNSSLYFLGNEFMLF